MVDMYIFRPKDKVSSYQKLVFRNGNGFLLVLADAIFLNLDLGHQTWPFFWMSTLLSIDNSKNSKKIGSGSKLISLERALRALASSSGGAACPGSTRGQPQESGGLFQGDLSEKKICDGHRTPNGQRMDRQTWKLKWWCRLSKILATNPTLFYISMCNLRFEF